ncbi:MAG: CPBP family intramembrane metalloprotease [Lachnospiraceae bacterium]|jgi:membrane protease YdiL (CAAX protease family)|nr:CPBP family intramembrane metalloprotease [Lachnospiraceae bacterium]
MDAKREGWLKILWRLFYPLFLYMGIIMVVRFIISLILGMKVLIDSGMMAGMSFQQITVKVMDLYLGVAYYETIVSAMIAIPFLYFFFWRDKKGRMAMNEEVRYCRATFMEYVLLGMVAFGACIGVNNLFLGSGLVEIDPAYQQVREILYSAPLAIQLAGTGLIAPLCEELIFRGLLHNRLKEYTPVKTACILSALAFAVYHGNMVQGMYAAVLGFLMAYVYEKYHSFLAPFLFHATANTVAVLITETEWFDFLYVNKAMVLLSGLLGIVVMVLGVRIIRDTVKLDPENPASKVEL